MQRQTALIRTYSLCASARVRRKPRFERRFCAEKRLQIEKKYDIIVNSTHKENAAAVCRRPQ